MVTTQRAGGIPTVDQLRNVQRKKKGGGGGILQRYFPFDVKLDVQVSESNLKWQTRRDAFMLESHTLVLLVRMES